MEIGLRNVGNDSAWFSGPLFRRAFVCCMFALIRLSLSSLYRPIWLSLSRCSSHSQTHAATLPPLLLWLKVHPDSNPLTTATLVAKSKLLRDLIATHTRNFTSRPDQHVTPRVNVYAFSRRVPEPVGTLSLVWFLTTSFTA